MSVIKKLHKVWEVRLQGQANRKVLSTIFLTSHLSWKAVGPQLSLSCAGAWWSGKWKANLYVCNKDTSKLELNKWKTELWPLRTKDRDDHSTFIRQRIWINGILKLLRGHLQLARRLTIYAVQWFAVDRYDVIFFTSSEAHLYPHSCEYLSKMNW